MPEHTVTSEIYEEFNYKTDTKPSKAGNVISEFPFLLPKESSNCKFDKDDDLDIERPQKEVIKIEHSSKTKISLVGLQVWRGAFLLGDLLIHLGHTGALSGKTVMELGAGTGISSFVAAIYAKKIICTDIDVGGILELIKLNAKYNSKLIKSQFKVMPLDFTNIDWDRALLDEIKRTDIIIAADVIYDDDVTAAFISTVQKLLKTKPPKTLYMVLEKRYVFTIEHMDSVAPCYETFLTLLDKLKTDLTLEQLPLDFPKYFTYDRVKDLVLWKITSKQKS
ncbi:methyltransferase-like protein 22 [Melitaea cinxia]|uniref:methyltransferase-like protein 22 n=1 Tax=Melitaea cinxia TaxID=113334 RepID=UPI001E27327D|nr:methyltransferase-like protein 22 [Melitaea cinxia]